ncbi:FtsK/SpoIIIE domain-containing protein [Neobacillus cucumis]|uniref:FtsK/SpoIIIE domain-containing protein n=1 Tax=Neobacillus cucumis TaxID=1740721 RepID=UPI0028533FED|nr:FtsK/SpoIIIE domain-containing protein [Neobacillus cucumis]MDR4945201.1 FtsK/SpoIIIE domain-containing protein [Neobacillus cucumis]
MREDLISQYTDYLNGVDNPIPTPFIRTLQKKMIFVLDKILSQVSEREPVEDIERKIIDDCFHFELRIVMNGEVNLTEIKEKMSEYLIPYTYLNSFRLVELDEQKLFPFIHNRTFSPLSKSQILSKAELFSFFQTKIRSKNTLEEVIADINDHDSEHLNKMGFIHLLPEGKPQKTDSQEHRYVQIFENSLRNLQLLGANECLNIISIEEGATLRKITISLPSGIKLSEMKSNLENIQAQSGIDHIEISRGATPGTVSFMFPKEEKSIVYLRDLLINQQFMKFVKKSILPFSIGTDEIGTPIYIDIAKVYHLLIAGSTGSGKSVFLVQLLLSLLLIKKPSELQLYLIDPKRVELKKFKEFPHVKELVFEPDEALILLNSLVLEMERRYELLDDHDVDELGEYNKKNPKNNLPYLICVIDEFADLIMMNEEVKHSIVRLGQKARACGIHLICATQRPEAKIVDGLIKANLPTKISFRCSSINDYKTVFGTSQPYHLLGNGDGSIKLEGASKEFIRFQGPVIHEDKSIAQNCLRKIATLIENDGVQGIELINNVEASEKEVGPLDKLKTIIANTGETRISQLQKEMKTRINTVQDLMAILVEEGWLIKHKAKSKGYELIASEEELERYRGKGVK